MVCIQLEDPMNQFMNAFTLRTFTMHVYLKLACKINLKKTTIDPKLLRMLQPNPNSILLLLPISFMRMLYRDKISYVPKVVQEWAIIRNIRLVKNPMKFMLDGYLNKQKKLSQIQIVLKSTLQISKNLLMSFNIQAMRVMNLVKKTD